MKTFPKASLSLIQCIQIKVLLSFGVFVAPKTHVLEAWSLVWCHQEIMEPYESPMGGLRALGECSGIGC